MLAASAMISSASAGVEAPIVIAGAGLHGAALAYYLTRRGEKPLIIDRAGVASAASGKGGGFLARDWGSGPTAALHRVSFALHEQLANDLDITSYRRCPTPAHALASLQPNAALASNWTPLLRHGDAHLTSSHDRLSSFRLSSLSVCPPTRAGSQYSR